MKAWLTVEMTMPAIAAAVAGGDVDGATAIEMDKDDWKELRATGVTASKIVGRLKKLV